MLNVYNNAKQLVGIIQIFGSVFYIFRSLMTSYGFYGHVIVYIKSCILILYRALFGITFELVFGFVFIFWLVLLFASLAN